MEEPSETTQPVVSFERVSVRLGARVVLNALSFCLTGPGVTVLVGPNGAGKSTLISVLLGLRRADQGAVNYLSPALATESMRKRRVAAVLQNEGSFEGATVGEYAALFAALYAEPALAEQILTLAKLSPSIRTPHRVEQLSGGEHRRLQLAAALALEPALLVLDEPTNQLDPTARRELLQVIAQRAKSTAILLATHDLAETATIADRVLMLLDGQLVAQGSVQQLIAQLPESLRGSGLSAVYASHMQERGPRA
jgi:ABC-2 type transport system ATP-binding protein